MPEIPFINDPFTNAELLDYVVRLLIACFCGGVIGFERSRRLKDAGIRTHVIVCCSSALLIIVSKYGFTDLYERKDYYTHPLEDAVVMSCDIQRR